jgi:hypothetical protein
LPRKEKGKKILPYVVVWHVNDHAEGELFLTKESALNLYKSKEGGSWAARLYDSDCK